MARRRCTPRLAIVAALAVGAGLMAPSIAHAATTCDGRTATIEGTDENDEFTGTSDVDVIAGLGGDDEITALEGNDVICAGAGRDFVAGGPGDDVVLGGAGSDAPLAFGTIVIGDRRFELTLVDGGLDGGKGAD
ncbi:MAG: calcium-binding protein, partial [Actinomycetota bacterium]